MLNKERRYGCWDIVVHTTEDCCQYNRRVLCIQQKSVVHTTEYCCAYNNLQQYTCQVKNIHKSSSSRPYNNPLNTSRINTHVHKKSHRRRNEYPASVTDDFAQKRWAAMICLLHKELLAVLDVYAVRWFCYHTA